MNYFGVKCNQQVAEDKYERLQFWKFYQYTKRQYQLGVLVDVSDKAVSKWKNGESEPSIDKLIKLSKYFGVNIDESMSFR